MNTNPKQPYVLYIDSREKENTLNYLKQWNIQYELITLPVGDMQIETPEGRVTIERKQMTDFIGSLLSGRLEDQMRRLANEPVPGLLLTGSFSEYRKFAKTTHFTSDQVIGAVASCIVKYGLRFVVWVQSAENQPHATGVALAAKIIKKIAEGKLDQIPPRKVNINAENPQRDLICLACGVPLKVAENLLKHFNNCVIDIMTASDEELLKVDGIGPGRILRMRRLLGIKGENKNV